MILNDASKDGMFKDNVEVTTMGLRSVMCLPVIKQSKMIGVLYLENHLSDDVFTSKKAQMTDLLTSQTAISLENSRLVDDMKKAESQVKKSLSEKEALLKEIHHRVKNNLQIIHNILDLQMPYILDGQAIELFKESKDRVYSMALIHEKLYQSESLAKIDLHEYIQSLTNNLFLSYGVSERVIKPKIYVENITLNVDTVIPCALIINELVSNSLKHAFPDNPANGHWTGEIYIDLRHGQENKLILTVGDNGVGMPEDYDIQKSETLGLRLVSVLAGQLKGLIKLNQISGTEFAIIFEAVK